MSEPFEQIVVGTDFASDPPTTVIGVYKNGVLHVVDDAPAWKDPGPHLHDFHTGGDANAVCTICKLTKTEVGVRSGAKTIGEPDDEWRAPEIVVGPALGAGPEVGSQRIEGPEKINRMDVVAYAWAIRRRIGEDDASLAVRVKRACYGPQRGTFHYPPPMHWEPPPGFKLGDDWRKSSALPATKPTVTIEAEYEEAPAHDEPGMKRLN